MPVQFRILCLSVLLCSALSCKRDNPEPPYQTTPYAFTVPQGFPEPIIQAYNPMTVEGVELGRRLYYDNILSMNGLSCSSCHHQSSAFSSPDFGPSGQGILAHINLAWNPEFGWTGSEGLLLDDVCLADVAEGNLFLNSNNDSIRARFARHADYPTLFKHAFNVDIVNTSIEERQKYIAFAVAQFMRTQVSASSRFDLFRNHVAGATLSQSEFHGYQIFFSEKGDCFHCHSTPLFTDNNFHNNGLDSTFSGQNLGRFLMTGNEADKGKFSPPTLRNIELTAPYMHDNRFQTLEEVIEFYNSGVILSPTVDPIMTKPSHQFGLQLSQQDKDDLVAFLKTLTDTAFVNNPALANPF